MGMPLVASNVAAGEFCRYTGPLNVCTMPPYPQTVVFGMGGATTTTPGLTAPSPEIRGEVYLGAAALKQAA